MNESRKACVCIYIYEYIYIYIYTHSSLCRLRHCLVVWAEHRPTWTGSRSKAPAVRVAAKVPEGPSTPNMEALGPKYCGHPGLDRLLSLKELYNIPFVRRILSTSGWLYIHTGFWYLVTITFEYLDPLEVVLAALWSEYRDSYSPRAPSTSIMPTLGPGFL